uniref:Orf102 protein n=1 Tax=Vitis riparia x Vitis cinerea TaxID=2018007 RepID=A0A654ID79_9ROSI|nr:orf102 [Vitis riparia x Vitis cinerea]
MSLKQSVLSLLYFRIPRMSRPILTSFMRSWTTKPPPQRKMSPTPARTTIFIVIFLAGSVRRDKREMLSISQKQIPPPHAPTVRLPRNRKGGPGARASWVGV